MAARQRHPTTPLLSMSAPRTPNPGICGWYISASVVGPGSIRTTPRGFPIANPRSTHLSDPASRHRLSGRYACPCWDRRYRWIEIHLHLRRIAARSGEPCRPLAPRQPERVERSKRRPNVDPHRVRAGKLIKSKKRHMVLSRCSVCAESASSISAGDEDASGNGGCPRSSANLILPQNRSPIAPCDWINGRPSAVAHVSPITLLKSSNALRTRQPDRDVAQARAPAHV